MRLRSKVNRIEIRQRVVDEVLSQIDSDLATYVAQELGLEVSQKGKNQKSSTQNTSEKLSIEAFPAQDIKQRKIAVLVHDGTNSSSVNAVKTWAKSENAIAEVLAPNAAPVQSKKGDEIAVDGRQNSEPSVTYDALVVIDGNNLDAFKADGVAVHYLLETFKHLKPIVLLGDKAQLLEHLGLEQDAALFIGKAFKELQKDFKQAIQNHRLWDREEKAKSIPA